MDKRQSRVVVEKKRSRHLTSPLVQVPVVVEWCSFNRKDKKRSRLLPLLKQERHFISFFCALAVWLSGAPFYSKIKHNYSPVCTH